MRACQTAPLCPINVPILERSVYNADGCQKNPHQSPVIPSLSMGLLSVIVLVEQDSKARDAKRRSVTFAGRYQIVLVVIYYR